MKLVETFKAHNIMGRREIVESIAQAQKTFIRTRFLSITSEVRFHNFHLRPSLTALLLKDEALPPAPPLQASSTHALQADSTAIPYGISSPGTVFSRSPVANARLPPSPAIVSRPQPPSALPHPTAVVGAQSLEAIEQSPNDSRNPSPTESHYSDAREEVKPPEPPVHRNPGSRLSSRPSQVPASMNPIPLASSPGASLTAAVESSVTPTPTISNPDNPPVADSSKPEQKPPVSFVRRVLRRIGW